MRVALFGSRGKVGTALRPALVGAGHEVRDADPAGCDAARFALGRPTTASICSRPSLRSDRVSSGWRRGL